MIKSIRCDFNTIDEKVNQWIETNDEYMVLGVNAVYCDGQLLAIINYEEIEEEIDCPYKDTYLCDGECDDCAFMGDYIVK